METKTAALQKKRSEIMSTKVVSAVQRCKAAAVEGEINMALHGLHSFLQPHTGKGRRKPPLYCGSMFSHSN